ncbi:MAG: transglycosylase domain-containing protein [Actinomycetota bacterium]|nr:transglycosylase domain-containing protein [Actinomycetota bacterium]
MNVRAGRLPQAVAVFVVVSIVVPILTLGTALGSLLFLPLPAPALPPPKFDVPSRVTHILDTQGNEIGTLRRFETNIPTRKEDIPDVLKEAVIAQEDRRFYSHRGFDPKAAMRALWADISGGKAVEGGSTITQQYIKATYTGSERTLQRKLREAVLAARLEREISKEEILYRYLDNIYLGGGAYGVGAAAESYFKKRVNDVNLSESALLAGLIASPSVYEPRTNPTGADRRRKLVLWKMRDQGRITEAEYQAALRERVFLVGAHGPPPSTPATLIQPLDLASAAEPYVVDYVRRYLIARYGDDLTYGGGLRVETSFDPETQAQAEKAVSSALSGTSPPLEMAIAAVEPSTGFVRALVGGRDFAASQVNLALGGCPETNERPKADVPVCIAGGGTGRQPGSAFKPITLARAFEEGIGPNRVFSGPGTIRLPGWTVSNVESGSYGSVSLRQATHASVNTVYAQLVLRVGVKDTAEMAHRLGLTSVDPSGVNRKGEAWGGSLTLGAAETSPLDMAAAFAVFANRGSRQPATPVIRITDPDGHVIEDNTKRKGRQVISPEVADNVTDVLKGVVSGGTGNAANIGRPGATAGKTGTSENFGNAWFVGYTPALSAAVWMGYADEPRPMTGIKGVSRVYGGTIPARTWHDFMIEAMDGVDTPDFPPPGPLPDAAVTLAPGPKRDPAGTDLGGPYQVVAAPPPTVVAPTTLPPSTTTTTTRPGLLPGIIIPNTTTPDTRPFRDQGG